MNSLDKDQLELIKADVESAQLTLLTLSHELVDHICCEVENEMTVNGGNFEEAYSLIKKQTGIHVLQKIQENTLYLTDKNFALMKTIMKITGNFSLALLGMGTVLKIFHWPGAGPAIVLGFVFLCLVFFPAAIYLNHKESSTKGKLFLNISILIGGIVLMAGILFKIMHWPGSSPLMVCGWLLIIFIFVPILLYTKLKEARNKSDRRIYILGALSLTIFELSTMFKVMHWQGAGPLMLLGSFMMISLFLPMFTYSKFKESQKITGQFIYMITISLYAVALTSLLVVNVSKDVLASFDNETFNSSKIIHYFEKKKGMQTSTEGFQKDSLNLKTDEALKNISAEAGKLQNLITVIKLKAAQADEAGSDMQLDRSNEAAGLKAALEVFKENACIAAAADPGLSERIRILLDTSGWRNGKDSRTWEQLNFENNTIQNNMAVLAMIGKNVRMTEAKISRYLKEQKLQSVK